MIDITYFANRGNAGREAVALPCRSGRAAGSFPVTYRGIVYPWHLDHMDRMNVQHYVAMFDQSSWVLMSMLGLDAEYFRENYRGLAALEQTIRYWSELRAGDMFEIRSAIIEIREKTMRIVHNMHN